MKLHSYSFPIETERLYFRPLSHEDVPAWTTFFINNPNLHFVGVTDQKAPELQSELWIDRQIKRYDETGVGILAACHKQSHRLVGNAGIIWRDDILGKPEFEIGYSVIPELWGQGLASEMAIALKQYFIHQQISNRVVSIIHIDNVGSQQVALKNGMSRGPQFEFLSSPCYLYQCEV